MIDPLLGAAALPSLLLSPAGALDSLRELPMIHPLPGAAALPSVLVGPAGALDFRGSCR